MTLTGTWLQRSNGEDFLWMAADTRISSGHSKLMDEGVKVFEVPVMVHTPGDTGFFDRVAWVSSIGLACAGATLNFQQVYATLVPLFADLITPRSAVPSLRELTGAVSRLFTGYTLSLGAAVAQSADANIVVAGRCPRSGQLEAYELTDLRDEEGRHCYVPSPLDLRSGPHFTGDPKAIEQARSLVATFEGPGDPVLKAIKAVIDDPDIPGVGGTVQLACSHDYRMRRMATAVPGDEEDRRGRILMNNIDVALVAPIGPCWPGSHAFPA